MIIHRSALTLTLAMMCLLVPTPSNTAHAEDLSADQIRCKLDPSCRKPLTRGFIPRGVSVEGEAKQEPLAVDLYVNFAFDSDELMQDGKITLQQLGTALKDKRIENFTFTIAGHTDAKGTPEYNKNLSQRRAETVRRFLETNYGIAASRLTAVGYGETQLLDRARPEDGVNRRVQVINSGSKGQ